MENDPPFETAQQKRIRLETLGRKSLIEIALVFLFSTMSGEILFRLGVHCRHHIFFVLANATLTTFMFFMLGAALLGVDSDGRRDLGLEKISWFRWLMLAAGPMLNFLVVFDK